MKNGVVHRLEDVGDRHEWTVCRRHMTRSGDLDHFPKRRSNDAVTCVFCLAGVRWRDYPYS